MFAPCPWDGYAPSTVRFCEERLCASIVEPANAWSNLGFLAVGIYLFHRSFVRTRAAALEGAGRKAKSPLVLFGVTGVLVSAGSFVFHMTATFWGEFLDLSAMFFISSLMLTFELRHILGLSKQRAIATYAGLSFGSMALVLAVRPIGIGLFIAHITVWTFLAMGLSAKSRRFRTWQLPTLMGIFLAGFGVWNLDIHRVVCNPTNHAFNGHVVWHLTCAVSLLLYYVHHERVEDRAPAASAT